MDKEITVSSKIYPNSDGRKLSMTDMLSYFEKHGVMRVSDLHIKSGAIPAYRIDGNLVKLNGSEMTYELDEGLIFPIIGEKSQAILKKDNNLSRSR